ALEPKAASSNVGCAKCPPGVASATQTPPLPKPTMSAMWSAFTSASRRGLVLLLLQPPVLGPKAESSKVGCAKGTPGGPSVSQTPSLPKPTRSANPSAFTSATSRGYVLSLLQPPALGAKAESSKVGCANVIGGGPPFSSTDTVFDSAFAATRSGLPSPFKSPI